MNLLQRRRLVKLGLLALFIPGAPVLANPLPKDSLYQMQANLQDHHGAALQWSQLQGQVRLLTMFYASCPHTCPLTIESIKALEQKLTAAQRQRLFVDLLSIDPERDTSAKLKALATQRQVQDARWHLYQCDAAAVRNLSALLGVQYRKLPDGEFNHSSVLVLLDAQGRVLARTERAFSPEAAFVAALQAALN
jgi:protein SCO1